MERTVLKSGARPPDASWSFELPDKLKIAIPDAIVVFARLETTLLEIVWILEESNLEQKKALVRDFVSKNFKKLKTVVTIGDCPLNPTPRTIVDRAWANLISDRNNSCGCADVPHPNWKYVALFCAL
jgi:hypothetical protein